MSPSNEANQLSFIPVQSTASTQSTQSTNSNSNVIVVCIGNSFKTKCFTSSNTSSTTPPASPNLAAASASPNHCNYNSTNNGNPNHNLASSAENNGNRINCQMNNLLEEDEEELEGEKIDEANDDKLVNGAHLSQAETALNGNGVVLNEQPQSHLINRVNGLKTETCI